VADEFNEDIPGCKTPKPEEKKEMSIDQARDTFG